MRFCFHKMTAWDAVISKARIYGRMTEEKQVRARRTYGKFAIGGLLINCEVDQ